VATRARHLSDRAACFGVHPAAKIVPFAGPTMKTPLLATALAVMASFSLGARLAAEDKPAPAASAEVSAPSADGPEADLKTLVDRIKAKLKAGEQTEAALAPELKEFDTLLAKYHEQKTDIVAAIGVMKARLYLEVFNDEEKALALLKQVKADFSGTQVAANVAKVITALEAKAAAEAQLAVGREFPTFAEQDLDGKSLDLASFKGKIVLVDFWATWCGPCVRELPNVIAAYEKYHAKGFEIVGISLDQDKTKLTDFLKERKMTWAQYFDGQGWENKLSQKYGISSIPATFLLDKDGNIIAKDLRGPALDEKLSSLLGN
jgi:thiol-disulfide isomerase/thioredoxin